MDIQILRTETVRQLIYLMERFVRSDKSVMFFYFSYASLFWGVIINTFISRFDDFSLVFPCLFSSRPLF